MIQIKLDRDELVYAITWMLKRHSAMTKPVPDKAEVAVEYPDKFYIGTFERTARFDAHLDEAGISLSLHREGTADTRKSVRMHFHYALFAEILRDLAKTVASLPPADVAHREALRDAAGALYLALKADEHESKNQDDLTGMTPDEEVRLLHLME
ncbi:MAG: hypothetical protein WBD95_03175 [Xanthobacteraceae bacterium]